ncbi:DCDC2 (predicted) [Pycnogonum litorale]
MASVGRTKKKVKNGGGGGGDESTGDSKDTKCIDVYENGNGFNTGARCIINPRQIRNFDSLLTFLTGRLKPKYGAVRNVYTPVNGHRVTELRKIKSNQSYVVAGKEKFKKLNHGGYTHFGENKRITAPKKTIKKSIKPVSHSRIRVSSKFRTANPKVITIYIYRNGDELNAPVTFSLGPRDVTSWETLLQTVAEKVQLQSGFVKKLYSLDGIPVKVTELQNGGQYVAVGYNESYKKVNYGEHKDWTGSKNVYSSESKMTKKQIKDGETNERRPKSKESKRRKSRSTPPFQRSASGDDESSNDRAIALLLSEDYRNNRFLSSGDKEELDPSGSLLAKMAELDAAELKGYKAKDVYRNDAREIQDSVDTAVEVPLDHLEAQEVKEERYEKDVKNKFRGLRVSDPEELIVVTSKIQNNNKKINNLFRIETGRNTLPAAF